MEIDVRLLAPLATLCAICVSIILWRLNQQRKSLSYQVLAQEDLVSIKGPARRKMRVSFDGLPVEDSSLVMIRIFNSGNKSINAGDYQTDLCVRVNPGADIVLADIAETSPANLEERCKTAGAPAPLIKSVNKGKVTLSPVLLNPGDEIVIQMLVNKLKQDVKLVGHLEGISAPKKWKPSRTLQRVFMNVGALVMAGAMLCIEPSAIKTFGWEEILPFVLIFLLGYVIFSAGLYWTDENQTVASHVRV